MPLKHPVRCQSAELNHARSRPVPQEIRASPSCRAASGRCHRDEGGSRADPSERASANRLTASVPGMARRLASRRVVRPGQRCCRGPCPRLSVPASARRVHRQSEPLLGTLGRLVHVAARHVADDHHVHVIRRRTRDPRMPRGPRPVDSHRDSAEVTEFLVHDELRAEREGDQLGQRPGVAALRVGHQPSPADPALAD